MTSLKVAVRVRPLSERESILGSKVVVDVQGKDILVTDVKVPEKHGCDHRVRVHRFTFDYGFWSVEPTSEKCASQGTVYEEFGRIVLNTMLEGYNCCVIAYGPSGSGKTYTIMGTKEDSGLTPRICEGLFTKLRNETDHHLPFQIDISFMELYNEQVFDLLQRKEAQNRRKPKLRVREHPIQGPFVEGLTTHTVKNVDEVCDLLARGNAERRNAATHVHERSSRSHAIFTIQCSQACLDHTKPKEVVSKLHLVDLAGSEKAAPEFCHLRVKEGSNINKSLVTLGNVIAVLVEMSLRSRNGGSVRKQTYVPYRDSHLTWLLKDSLGGNSHTFMLAAISPSKDCYIDTVGTLRYAQRAKLVMNRPVVNEDPSTEMIRNLRTEVARLRNLLCTAEKLSKAYVMNPLPEISQLRTIMRESARKVDMLTKHWFEKWLQTYDVVIKQVGHQEHEEITDTTVSELLNNDGMPVVSCAELEVENSLQDSAECVIMKNEVVRFYKDKGPTGDMRVVSTNRGFHPLEDQQNEQLEAEYNENTQIMKKDFNDCKKHTFRKNFESVSENTLQACKSTDPTVLRSLSLSQTHMKKPFGVYTWLIQKTTETESEMEPSPQHQMVTHNNKDGHTRNKSGHTLLWDTDFENTRQIISFDDYTAQNIAAEYATMQREHNETLNSETIFCPDAGNRLNSVLRGADENLGKTETIHRSATDTGIGLNNSQRSETKDSYIAISASKENNIDEDAIPINVNGPEIQPLKSSSTVNNKDDFSYRNSNTMESDASKCSEQCLGCGEVTFSEQVSEESNNLVQLLNSIEPESIESGSGYYSPKRKDSEIMSLLSFSSLDGRCFRSLDDFTCNEESASVHANELRRGSMSSCDSDAIAVKPFHLRIPGSEEPTRDIPPLFKRTRSKQLNFDTSWKFDSTVDRTKTEAADFSTEPDIDVNFYMNEKISHPEKNHDSQNGSSKFYSDQPMTNISTLSNQHEPLPTQATAFKTFQFLESDVPRNKSKLSEEVIIENCAVSQAPPERHKDFSSEASDIVYATSFELTKANLDLLEEKLKEIPQHSSNCSATNENYYPRAFKSQIYPWLPQQKKLSQFEQKKPAGTLNVKEVAIEIPENNSENRMKHSKIMFQPAFHFDVQNSFDKIGNFQRKPVKLGYSKEELNVSTIENKAASEIVECSEESDGLSLGNHGSDRDNMQNSAKEMAVERAVVDGEVTTASEIATKCLDTAANIVPSCVQSFNALRLCEGSNNACDFPDLYEDRVLSKEELKHKDSEKDTESDFDTFTLDSLDNFDQEMKAWAQKYLTKCDSQQRDYLGCDKISKPEIISSGTKVSELREFELLAAPGKMGDSGVVLPSTKIPYPPYENENDLSSCSSSSSSDSITYVFVGKGEKESESTNINNVNSTSQYSSLQSSVSLDSLEKTGLQSTYVACPSPRTLSIDSLVAEELLHQLQNSALVPASKRGLVAQRNFNAGTRGENGILSPSLRIQPFSFKSQESNVETCKANIVKPHSPNANLEFTSLNNTMDEHGECGTNQRVLFKEDLDVRSKDYQIQCLEKENCRSDTKCVGDFPPVHFDFNRAEETVAMKKYQTSITDNATIEEVVTNENTLEELNLVIPPPMSFETEFVNIDNTQKIIKDAEMVSKSTQTQNSSTSLGDVSKSGSNSTQPDVLQLAFQMMELMTEIFKCLKDLRNNNSCCAARSSLCEQCNVRKKHFPNDSNDPSTRSSNGSLEVDQQLPTRNATKAHRSKRATDGQGIKQRHERSTSPSTSEETSDYKCFKETKRRRRHVKRENRSRFQPIDDCVREQLLQLPSFAKELISLRESEQYSRKSPSSNHLSRETTWHQPMGSQNTNEASILYQETQTKRPSISRTNPENQLKHWTEIRRLLVQETANLQSKKTSTLSQDINGNDPNPQLNKMKTQSNSSSEGYLSSISSRGESSHCSESHGEGRSRKSFSYKDAFDNRTSKFPKTKPLLLDVGTERHVTPPSTSSWQNTSADSGAFFMDSPLVEKKDFVDVNLNPYVCKESPANAQKFPESSAAGEFAERGRSISRRPSNLPFGRDWTKDSGTVSPDSLGSTLRRKSRDAKDEPAEDGEANVPSSLVINRIPPRSRGLSFNSSADLQNSSTSAQGELAKRLSLANYKITREDIERILTSIEADKAFLRRRRNPILDRCYSPEITLCSPSESDESLFSCDSFKKLPHPVLFVRTEASGLPA